MYTNFKLLYTYIYAYAYYEWVLFMCVICLFVPKCSLSYYIKVKILLIYLSVNMISLKIVTLCSIPSFRTRSCTTVLKQWPLNCNFHIGCEIEVSKRYILQIEWVQKQYNGVYGRKPTSKKSSVTGRIVLVEISVLCDSMVSSQMSLTPWKRSLYNSWLDCLALED